MPLRRNMIPKENTFQNLRHNLCERVETNVQPLAHERSPVSTRWMTKSPKITKTHVKKGNCNRERLKRRDNERNLSKQREVEKWLRTLRNNKKKPLTANNKTWTKKRFQRNKELLLENSCEPMLVDDKQFKDSQDNKETFSNTYL